MKYVTLPSHAFSKSSQLLKSSALDKHCMTVRAKRFNAQAVFPPHYGGNPAGSQQRVWK